MAKYLIQYQVEADEDYPATTVLSAKNEEDLNTALRNHVLNESKDFGLTKKESEERAESIIVLDCKKI